jgi:N-acetyl-1-D-myo-inositol-2-amino-2-deoxy-alpha-D-glucopyranoside deacetylase
LSRTLLLSFAHPDDEAFTCGCTVPRYAAEGVDIHLICATRGEEGEIADPALATPQTLARVRQAELENAADILGISSIEPLGYRDSGMEGTASASNPRAFVNAPAGRIVPRLVRLIRRLKPNVVLSFGPDGRYGHPDHIAISYHTVAAVQGAGQPGLYPEAGEPWTPDRLFFTSLKRSAFTDMLARMKAEGVDTSRFERPDMPMVGQTDDQIDVTIDGREFLEVKKKAMLAHRTQMTPEHPLMRLPAKYFEELMGTEYFTLAWGMPLPEGASGDLFAGLAPA